MVTTHNELAIGTPASDFDLPDVRGGRVQLASLPTSGALLVVFVCNHCPFVQHIEAELGRFAARYRDRGLTTIAINSNDVLALPEDDEDHMREQSKRAGWDFPHLFDADQTVAKAYGAACTPDLFLYDANRALAYRGEFDGSRPGGDVPLSGDSLAAAVECVLDGRPVPLPHLPLIGCSLKWAPGNEPG